MVYLKRPHLHYPTIRVDEILEETVRRCGNKPAFLYPSRVSYEELNMMINGFAQRLRESVAPGDRVALYAANSIEWVVAFFGILRQDVQLFPSAPSSRSTSWNSTLQTATQRR